MSAKQMIQAALVGRKLQFAVSTGTTRSGYLVGMDDYHWLVASPSAETSSVNLYLLHKGSVPEVLFTTALLDSEPSTVGDAVRQVGDPFFSWCARHAANRNTSSLAKPQESRP